MLEKLTPYVRHVIQLGAGALATRGIIDASMAEILVGLGVSVFTLGWMAWERHRAKPTPAR